MLKSASRTLLIFSALTSFAVAQETGHLDASINWGAVFNKTASAEIGTVSLKPTNSGVIFGSFRFRFNRMHALELFYGRTKNSQIYTIGADNFRVQDTIAEYTAAYVLSPFRFQKIDPFLLAGVGSLHFNPGNTYIDGFQSSFGAGSQNALTFLYGGGLDYRVHKRIALRLQYRGLFYKEPTFHLQQFFTGKDGHLAEPSLGVVFKF